MPSFTTVRYGSQFKPLKSPLSSYRVGSDLAPAGASVGGLAGLLRAQQPGFQATFPTFTPPASTPATAPTRPTPSNVRPAPAPTPRPPSSSYGGVDLSTDPILQQIRAIGQQRVADVGAQGTNAAEQALISYGDLGQAPADLKALYASDPSSPIYRALNDAGTASAAAANPDSQLAQLLRAHQANLAGIDTAENAQNLYYSSHHANQLADEANAYRASRAQAASGLEALLAQAQQAVLDAQNQANADYNSGLGEAYNRWLASHPDGLPVDTGAPGGASPTPPPTMPTGPTLGDLLRRRRATGAGGTLRVL